MHWYGFPAKSIPICVEGLSFWVWFWFSMHKTNGLFWKLCLPAESVRAEGLRSRCMCCVVAPARSLNGRRGRGWAHLRRKCGLVRRLVLWVDLAGWFAVPQWLRDCCRLNQSVIWQSIWFKLVFPGYFKKSIKSGRSRIRRQNSPVRKNHTPMYMGSMGLNKITPSHKNTKALTVVCFRLGVCL